MPDPSASHKVLLFRFGVFELDVRLGELCRDGERLSLPGQAMQILEILVSSPKQLVTREQLRQALWPDGTFVAFDDVLNQNIRRLRQALEDDADEPRFIETLPRRGYRFIAAVEDGVPPSNQQVGMPRLAKAGTWGMPMRLRLALLGAVVVVVGVLALWKTVQRTPNAPRVLRFTKLTDDGHVKVGPLVTDGVRVYFNELLSDGRSIIAQVSVRGGEAVPLSVPLKAPGVLDISKDGTEVLVANAEGNGHISIWVQSVAGGSLHRVGTMFEGINIDMASAAFAPDGTSIIYGQGHDVYLMNRDGASPRKLLTVDNIPHWYRFSADAKTLRFSQFDPNGPMNTSMSANADGTGLQKMFKGCCGDWTPDGRFFVFLRAVDGHINFWTLRESKIFSWQKQNHDAHVHEFVPYLSGISAEGLAFSPDGRWVAYTSYPDGILWRSRVDGSERLQLTLPPLKVFMPRWSPDGRQIAFNAALPRAPWNIHVVSSGGGSAERLLPSDQSQGDANWSPDGKSLVFGSAQDLKQSIYILDLSSRRVSTVRGSLGFFSPRWSPDGRYIAGMFSEVQGLVLFDVSTQKWTKVFDGDVDYPMWSHDGKYLYFEFHPAPDKPNRIVRLRLSDRKIENVAEVSSVGRLTTGWFGLTPDGSPLLARDIGTQEIYAIEVEWP